jgi:cytoskeletal protein CcmA (bactofilin family)
VESVALIGSSIHIKGTVTAREPLTIAGRVDGTVDVAGFPLTVTVTAGVSADIIAQSIVVGGSVTGTICTEGHIVVQKTATVEGELSAPSITVEDGATVQGKFDISGKRATLRLAS